MHSRNKDEPLVEAGRILVIGSEISLVLVFHNVGTITVPYISRDSGLLTGRSGR